MIPPAAAGGICRAPLTRTPAEADHAHRTDRVTTLPGNVPVTAPAVPPAASGRRSRRSACRPSPAARPAGATSSSRPWLIGFLVFTLAPMIASLRSRSPTSASSRRSRSRSWGCRTGSRLLRRRARCGRRWASRSGSRCCGCRSRCSLPFLLALGAQQPVACKGASAFRVLFFLPYVIPFVSGVLIWQGMLDLETGWINDVPALARASRTRPTGSTTPRRSTRRSCSSASGASARGSSSTSPACAGIPTELYDAARIDGAGYWAPAAQRDPADDVAGHLLHADPGHRGGAPVLPRAARDQQRHRRAGRQHAVLQPLPVQDVLHVPEHGLRGDARLAAVPRHADRVARRVPAPRGAGSTTRGSADDGGVRPATGRRAGARAAATTPRRPQRRADAGDRSRSRSCWSCAGRVPVAAAALGGRVAQDARPAVRDRLAVPALAAADVRARGQGATTSTSCRSDGRPRRSRSSSPAASRATSSTPRTPTPADHLAGLVADADPAWTLVAGVPELRRRVEPHRLPAAAVQHDRDRAHRDGRRRRLVHARRVRVRALPVPRPRAAVHDPHRDDLPARRRDDHPDVHDVREARLGGDLAAAPGARRSSPTPTTCS